MSERKSDGVESTYKVVGLTAYRGFQPGQTFVAVLTPDEERRAKERGSIRVVKRGDANDDPEGGGDA